MATALLARDEHAARKALESRADVESLEALQQARRELIVRIAPLRALHGPFGLWDDKRKQRLELAKVQAREALTQAGVKITEGAVEQAAYADPEYAALLAHGESDRVRYIIMENAITEIEERLRSREIELRAYTVEAGLR